MEYFEAPFKQPKWNIPGVIYPWSTFQLYRRIGPTVYGKFTIIGRSTDESKIMETNAEMGTPTASEHL